MIVSRRRFTVFVAVGSLVAACHSHDDETAPAKTATAAAVAGPAESRCGTKSVSVDPATCSGATADAGADAGAPEEGEGSEYGDTLFNSEGSDDECKYYLKWSAASGTSTKSTSGIVIRHEGETHGGSGSGGLVTFTLDLTNKVGSTPVTGAPIDIEAFLDETHPAPNSEQTSKEISPGKYAVGPIAFDVSGKWTVRFHIHGECADGESSPHGHGAFFVRVDVR